MIAPVLPGETLKNGLFQSRVISDPLKHRLLGAHKEYWFFYVRLRDLQRSADFEAMMNDGPEDYVSVLKRTQARLKEAMFSAGTPPGSLTGISKQLLALTREIERLEGNPAQGMTTQEDPEDDDDGEFRPEAI